MSENVQNLAQIQENPKKNYIFAIRAMYRIKNIFTSPWFGELWNFPKFSPRWKKYLIFFQKMFFSVPNAIRICAACPDRVKNGHFGILGYPGYQGGYWVPKVGHFGKSTHPIYSRTGHNWFEHDPWTCYWVMLRQLMSRLGENWPFWQFWGTRGTRRVPGTQGRALWQKHTSHILRDRPQLVWAWSVDRLSSYASPIDFAGPPYEPRKSPIFILWTPDFDPQKNHVPPPRKKYIRSFHVLGG